MNQLKKQIVNNNSKNKIPDRIFSPLGGITLNDGLFSRVFNYNRKFLQKIDLDAALYWFRKRAGKNAPGQPYRGHFEDNIKGQTAGLILMGAGNALRWVHDLDLEKLVNTIIDEIDDCSEDDGYLMAVPKEQFGTLEYPHYVRIWLTYGLYAAALGGNLKAMDMLRKWQDWFNSCDDLPIIKYLSLSFQGVVASPFVYNTPVGKKEDIDTTIKYYEEDWRLGQFIMREKDSIGTRRQPGIEPHPHGTELEALEGYLDLYRATGKHYYLRAVLNAYEMYKHDWQHVGGGIVMCEFLDAYPGCNWLSPPKPYNELCCTSFWILLNQRLHRLFPDKEEYVMEIEKSLYNVAIANQEEDKGIRYFAWIDKHKSDSGLVHCCCGVGTRLYSI
ncbi:MAG: glycoside hydrolase family 127 protein, partial [Treponema sp.]|nr:glycoside hydrolase family 127 protein [Treponema sp.]